MNTRAASIPKPQVPRSNILPAPPPPTEAKGNIQKGKTIQLNVRIDEDKHREIRIAAINEHMTLIEYVLFTHERYQEAKEKKDRD